jgi:short-subunit dehydrogenase
MTRPETIFITGASSGIGQALAEYYAAPGITLVLTGRDQGRLEAVARKLEDKGAKIHAACIDVTDRGAMAEWIEKIWDIAPFDLVIANAGISGGSGGFESGEPVAQAREIFNVNVTGVLNTVEPVIPLMLQQQKGQIALMSSLAGFQGWPSSPGYSASKGAVRFYGEALRGTLKLHNIKVNVICPGFVTSRMTAVNPYKMPFIMPADKAASIIAQGLSKNKARIAFPGVTYAFSWLLSVLPLWISEKILAKTPQKPGR